MAKLKRSMDRKRLTKENSVDIDNVSEHPTRRAPCYKQFLSARFLNDFFFVFYVSSLVISYIWLFVYMDVLKREMNEISNRNYNYTPITTFHSWNFSSLTENWPVKCHIGHRLHVELCWVAFVQINRSVICQFFLKFNDWKNVNSQQWNGIVEAPDRIAPFVHEQVESSTKAATFATTSYFWWFHWNQIISEIVDGVFVTTFYMTWNSQQNSRINGCKCSIAEKSEQKLKMSFVSNEIDLKKN